MWDTSRDTEGRKTLHKSRIQGGAIKSLKFDVLCPGRVYTASNCTVTRHHFNGGLNKVYLGK